MIVSYTWKLSKIWHFCWVASKKSEYFTIRRKLKNIFLKDTEAFRHPVYLCMKQTPLRTRLFILLQPLVNVKVRRLPLPSNNFNLKSVLSSESSLCLLFVHAFIIYSVSLERTYGSALDKRTWSIWTVDNNQRQPSNPSSHRHRDVLRIRERSRLLGMQEPSKVPF